MTFFRFLFSSYIIAVIALFFYSFTQVDLSLTLSSSSVFQTLEKQFQYIGFFQRPLSALIFGIIAMVLFIFYLSFLYLAKKNKLKIKTLRNLIFLTFLILVFSYNAFSYDLFNYIFDAKILTHYSQNPYFYRPIDFASDPMLNFMRWTHRFYPYGPSWLILTVPLSFIGANFFLPTFLLFKFMIGITYLGSVYLIYRISEILFPKYKIFNTVFFAFNPLVLIEGLVSSHNDFPMVFFGLLAIYFYLKKQKIYSFLSLIFSIGVKYSTVVFLPALIMAMLFERFKKNIPWGKLITLSIAFSLFAVYFASLRTTFQPWYLILPLALSSLISRKYYIFIPSIIASLFSILIYTVYVYMTDYAKGYPQVIANIELIGLIAAILFTVIYYLKTKVSSKH